MTDGEMLEPAVNTGAEIPADRPEDVHLDMDHRLEKLQVEVNRMPDFVSVQQRLKPAWPSDHPSLLLTGPGSRPYGSELGKAGFLFFLHPRQGGTMVVFQGEEQREGFFGGRWMRRLRRKGGRWDKTVFRLEVKTLSDMMPLYPTASYRRMAERYRDLAERQPAQEAEDLLSVETKCADKDRTFKCFVHIHQLMALRVMAKRGQARGGLSRLLAAVLRIGKLCQNNLADIVVTDTVQLLNSLIEKASTEATKLPEAFEEDEDEGIESDETDETEAGDVEENGLEARTHSELRAWWPTQKANREHLDNELDMEGNVFLSSIHSECDIINISSDACEDIITIE